MILQAPSDDLGLLDKNLLVEHLYKAALGGAGVCPLQHFNLMAAFLKWLSMHQEWLKLPFTPVTSQHVGWT